MTWYADDDFDCLSLSLSRSLSLDFFNPIPSLLSFSLTTQMLVYVRTLVLIVRCLGNNVKCSSFVGALTSFGICFKCMDTFQFREKPSPFQLLSKVWLLWTVLPIPLYTIFSQHLFAGPLGRSCLDLRTSCGTWNQERCQVLNHPKNLSRLIPRLQTHSESSHFSHRVIITEVIIIHHHIY